MKDKDDSAGSGRGRADPRRRTAEASFDRWLEKKLHELYDPVLDEELPEELRKLLDAFDEGDPGGERNGA